MALTRSLDILSMPMAAATLCTFLVLVPVAHVSATAATTARSTRRWRSSTSSGKKPPERSFGGPGVSVPTRVTGTLTPGSRSRCCPWPRRAGRPRRS